MFGLPSYAISPVKLTPEQTSFNLNQKLMILEDRHQQFSIQDIMAEPVSKLFKSNLNGKVNYGYTHSAYWVKLDLLNTTSENEWLLEINFPQLESIELYTLENMGKYTLEKTGNLLPFSSRKIQHHHPTFKLNLKKNQLSSFILRFESTKSMYFPLILWKTKAFNEKSNMNYHIFGIFFGALFLMIFYNFILFLSLRDKLYIFYVLYISMYTWLFLTISGFGFQYLWPQSPFMHLISIYISMGLLSLFLAAFSREFLKTATILPRWDKLYTALVAITITCSLFSLFSDAILMIKVTLALIFLNFCMVYAMAIIAYLKGERQARFFIIAWSVFFIGSILLILSRNGIIPANFWTDFSIYFGTILEVSLLSLALADRIHFLQQEKELYAQQLENYHNELEQRVNNRTLELGLALDEAEKASNIKSQFLANISHELRTPLNAIIGYNELLQEELVDNTVEQSLSDLKKIHISSQHLLNLINDILDLSKIEAGQLTLNYQQIDLNSAIKELCEMMQPLAQKNANQFKLIIDEKLDLMNIDWMRLRQVLINLLSNACKFTQNGVIFLKVELLNLNATETYLSFEVKDNGIGISPEHIDKLFQRFVQIDQSNTRSGTGIGLALSQQLARLMGGKITVQSTHGKGSIFSLKIPVSQ